MKRASVALQSSICIRRQIGGLDPSSVILNWKIRRSIGSFFAAGIFAEAVFFWPVEAPPSCV